MDQERFDQLTRTLATGQTRRGLLKGLTGTAIGGLLASVGLSEASAKGGKTSFCHRNDNGTYDYITVSQSAAAKHRAHGDVENPNFRNNVTNCGACGNVCSAPVNATATCDESSCGFTCDAEFEPDGNDGCQPVQTCLPADALIPGGCSDDTVDLCCSFACAFASNRCF